MFPSFAVTTSLKVKYNKINKITKNKRWDKSTGCGKNVG